MTAADPGDAVGMSMKDMVKDMWHDMKVLNTAVAVLCAAELPKRVDDLEKRRDISIGRSGVIALVVSGIVSVGGIILAAIGWVR